MTYEDFTTYTEVDPNSHITVSANSITHVSYRNEDAYVYKDKGVNHFTDFTHLVDVKTNASVTNSDGVVWMITDDINDWYGLYTAHKPFISVMWIIDSSKIPTIWLRQYDGTTIHNDQSVNLSANTWYYLKIVKSGTSITCYIYSDSARTTLVDTLTVTMNADDSFRYIFACDTSNTGTSGIYQTQNIDNLDLQEGGAILKEVTDSLSLSDAFLCDKTFAVADSVGLADAPLKNWIPLISDSVALSDVVLRDKIFAMADLISIAEIIEVAAAKALAVTDQIALSDMALILKQLRAVDVINLADAASTPSRILQVLDAVGLSDNAYVNKTLIVSDQIVLAEIVEKTVAGGVKTKIFLLIGDLAIQLSG
jgi:hypothetical protein